MVGVKELIDSYCPKIDWDKKAKTKAKELGVPVEDILKEWEEARDKGILKGRTLHETKQSEYDGKENYIRKTYEKLGEDFIYNPDDYKLENDYVYDEFPFVHPKYPLIGIPDRVYIADGRVNIDDFKSDKAIYMTAPVFKSGRFTTKRKMLSPVSHLDECNYIKYCLQLSFYMRLILDNNKTLRPGKMRILHTLHDEETLEPLEENIIEIPYYRKEVDDILKRIK